MVVKRFTVNPKGQDSLLFSVDFQSSDIPSHLLLAPSIWLNKTKDFLMRIQASRVFLFSMFIEQVLCMSIGIWEFSLHFLTFFFGSINVSLIDI